MNSYCSLPVQNQRELIDDLAAVMRVHGMATPLSDGIALALAFAATARGLVLINALHCGASLIVVTDGAISAEPGITGVEIAKAFADIARQCDRTLLMKILDCIKEEQLLALRIAAAEPPCECPDCLAFRAQLITPIGSN